MKVDEVIADFITERDTIDKRGFHERLIKKAFYHPKNSKILYVFVPQMEGSYTKHLKKLMRKRGYSFLEFIFSKNLLNEDYKKVIKNFEKIKKEIVKEIHSLKGKYNFGEINLIGVSIGNVSACLTVNENKDIDNLFLIVPGNCLAESMWEGVRTQEMRRKYRKQKIYLHDLKEKWKKLAPENNIDKIKAKKIFVFLSRSDEVIPYQYGHKLLRELKEKGYNVYSEINNKKGHYLTALDFYFHPKKYLFKE